MKEIYDWIPWFSNLAEAVENGGQDDLIRKVKQVNWGIDEEFLLRYGDENIDPFSFFYSLAYRNTRKYRPIVYPSVNSVFNLTESLPPFDRSTSWLFPTPHGKTSRLFHSGGKGNPGLLWKLFRNVRRGLKHVRYSEFNDALKIKSVGPKKLTQALFLINPAEFFPFINTKFVFHFDRFMKSSSFQWAEYQQVLEDLRDSFPNCGFHEMYFYCHIIDALSREGVQKERKVYQINTRLDGEDLWQEFNQNNWVRVGQVDHDRNQLGQPKMGDLVLVRTAMEGRGIGIVYRNDFTENNGFDAKIHVAWINKTKCYLELNWNQQRLSSFSKASGPFLEAFRNCQSYAPTFEAIDYDDKTRMQEPQEPKDDPAKPPTPDELVVKPVGTLNDLAHGLYLTVEFLGNIKKLIEEKQQVIFQGPPGTGKTYVAQELAKHLTRGHDDCWDLVQFHPSYSYEDFVRGYRPALENGQPTFKLKDGPLLRMVNRAKKVGQDQKCVLIIDEINRGNLAKVLGELYFLLEYRDKPIELMYQEDDEEPFRMPSNLYFIGTMNTADRSIALVDLALRRRFAFEEFDPYKEPICNVLGKWMQTVNSGSVNWLIDLVNYANSRLEKYNAAAIGPSYFMKKKFLNDEAIERIWKHEVLPYVAEQFFGDVDKIAEFQLDSLRKSLYAESESATKSIVSNTEQDQETDDADNRSAGE